MELRNLTPHAITLRANGIDTVIPPSGEVARVTSMSGKPEEIEGISVPVYGKDTFGDIEGLPEPEEGVLFIVSLAVASADHGRSDLVRPGTGPNDGAFRNEKNQVEAVSRLIRA